MKSLFLDGIEDPAMGSTTGSVTLHKIQVSASTKLT